MIVVEAALTYFIVLLLSEAPRRFSYWSSLFGRDRFFVILLVSVIVRAVLDGFLLPWAGQIAVEDYGINFDYRNNLHSFGLIIVALIANYFWKPGIVRGLPPLATCVAITYVVIQFALVPYTNFNIGNFHLIYDDLTTSMMASPKAYILVLTTAYVASWMNLRYAWDFNGILIPALLGLMWHDPAKIFVSGVECILLCVVGSHLIRLSVFRKMTIQGSRKILFFFTICFAYRLIICHVLSRFMPSVSPTDAFGFGYLLSTLMAIKISDKQKAIAMLFGTAKVSMLGAVAGSLVGFAFFCGPRISFSVADANSVIPSASANWEIQSTDMPLHQVVRNEKPLLYEKRKRDSYRPPSHQDLHTFRRAVNAMKRLQCPPDQAQLESVAETLNTVNYGLKVIKNRYLFLRERSPANGWGMYVVDLQNQDDLNIQVPEPLREWSTLESGISLFRAFPSRSLAIAGSSRKVNFGGEADVLNQPETMFNVFGQVFRQESTLQVRGYTRTMQRELYAAEKSEVPQDVSIEDLKSRVYVRGVIPQQLRFANLKELTGTLDVRWNESPTNNALRQWTTGNHVELILNRADRRRLVAQLGSVREDLEGQSRGYELVEHSLSDWLVGIKDQMVQQGTDRYVPAKVEEMLFMDQEVFTPLISILAQLPSSAAYVSASPSESPIDQTLPWMTDEIANELLSISDAAASQNYQLSIIIDRENEAAFICVSELAGTNAKGWGTFVFRPGLAHAFAVEVPRPLFERRSFDFGASLFQRPRAAAMLIAGAHPRANLDGSADISKAANRVNLFNLVRHVLLRQLGDRPFLISQARAIQAPVEADIVIATDEGARSMSELTSLKDQLLRQLTDDRLSVAFVDGSKETAGYELGILMQATSVQVSQNKEVLSLWLSPSLRSKFREQTENHALTAQFNACGISTVQEKLGIFLNRRGFRDGDPTQGAMLPDRLRHELADYVDTNDVVRLLRTGDEFPAWKFVRVVDGASGQAFLLIQRDAADFPAILNLTGALTDTVTPIQTYKHSRIGQYASSRTLWLMPVAAEPRQATTRTDRDLVLRGAK